jgi:hypothetical protein
MNQYIKLCYATTLLLLFSGCQLIAEDKLRGTYEGTVTYVLKSSELNVGVPDEIHSRNCYAIFFTTGDKPSIVVANYENRKSEAIRKNIDIAGIKLLTNGASFNIPEQHVKEGDTPVLIMGNSGIIDTEGFKSDGFIDDDDNLQFSYSGLAAVNVNGIVINPRFECIYHLKKKQAQ